VTQDHIVKLSQPGTCAHKLAKQARSIVGDRLRRDFKLGIQALKRLAQPDDIGGVIAFLASDDARWIAGLGRHPTKVRLRPCFFPGNRDEPGPAHR
jgi:hypothetical protein